MSILIRQATVIHPGAPFHGQQADILIKDGTIHTIGSFTTEAKTVIDLPNLHVSLGWMDPFAQFGEPGFEFRETLQSGAACAAAGGYTDVMVLPNLAPVTQNKSGVEFIRQRSSVLPVDLHPIGAITKNAEGKELGEMYEMANSGALAFSDGVAPIQNAGLLVKALLYLKAVNGTLIQVPNDRSLNPAGLMNEGIVSTRLGLPGIPALAEELMIRRDIELSGYTDSAIHITGVSTEKGITLIKEAKLRGLKVTCSVTPFHLHFTEDDLIGYDTNLKMNPPFRTSKDRDALRQAVLDGTVDCIASHHLPHDADHKEVEFEYAGFGAISLETSFALVRSALPQMPPAQLVQLFSQGPRKIFNQHRAMEEGAPACITLFQPDENWTYSLTHSRSRNSMLFGKTLKGRVLGIINKGHLFLNEF